MTKNVHLVSLIQANQIKDNNLVNGFNSHLNCKMKSHELNCLQCLVRDIKNKNQSYAILNGYYFDYSIPQISRQFDLLRFGENKVVNIELKSTNTGDRIEAQLRRNKYYLNFLGRQLYLFSYVSDEGKLYELDSNSNFRERDIEDLIAILQEQTPIEYDNLDLLFNPSDYLVSPFNSPDEFLRDEYFLTNQQEDKKRIVIKAIEDGSEYSIVSISGKPGTGKTLLTYNIAKNLMKEGYEIVLIHVGQLNNGHLRLQQRGWDIRHIKDAVIHRIKANTVIIVDEAQRLKNEQLRAVLTRVKKKEVQVIFSLDPEQTLRFEESTRYILKQIRETDGSINIELKEKIRTNIDLNRFIKSLMNRNRPLEKLVRPQVSIAYYDSLEDAKKHQALLYNDGWKIINYTESKYNVYPYDSINYKGEYDNSHTVIGQEFDKVCMMIDNHLGYAPDGKLVKQDFKSYYYQYNKLFYQNITRTRNKLFLIIVGNQVILKRCTDILNKE